MRTIIRAIPIIVALIVIAAVVAYRQQPGHHAPVSIKGLLVFVAVFTVAHVVVRVLTRTKGRARSRRTSPYGY